MIRDCPASRVGKPTVLLPMAASEPELVSARIDEDIPLAALGDLQWRP